MFRRSFNGFLVERLKRESELKNIDKSRWYDIAESCIPPDLLARFHRSSYDDGTDSFIARCYAESASLTRMLFYAFARSVLKLFMSATSACGFLRCGSMFVFSREQFRQLVIDSLAEHIRTNKNNIDKCSSTTMIDMIEDCNENDHDHDHCHHCNHDFSENFGDRNNMIDSPICGGGGGARFGSLLDIGAGDGNVTATMSSHFAQTFVTEMSRFMHSRLSERGYRRVDALEWMREVPLDSLHLISLLNVLDRCDEPLKMLAEIHRALRVSGGLLLLAIVFPLCQYVEYKSNHLPAEILPVDGATFEHQVGSFYHRVLLPAGFEVLKWTKLPYLCEGNIDLTYFWLIDAVFLLKPIEPIVSGSAADAAVSTDAITTTTTTTTNASTTTTANITSTLNTNSTCTNTTTPNSNIISGSDGGLSLI